MRRQNYVVFLLVIGLFTKINGQENTDQTPSTTSTTTTPSTTSTTTTPMTTTWNGDPNLCPPNPEPTPIRPMPNFPKRVEFALEQIEYERIETSGIPGHRVLQQHIFDYNANALIIVKNKNNIITAEYYYYKDKVKSIYIGTEYCFVQPITENLDMDGTSAIQLDDGTWHLRPLNEYLLFSNLDERRTIVRPRFIEETTVRGIPVEVWQSCYVDKTNYRTVQRTWSLARSGTLLPNGVVTNETAPIQAIIRSSRFLSNGTFLAEVDEIYNVFDYKAGIQESASDLSPPRGVFCQSNETDAALISLDELGISWPDHFSVRVETSTTRLSKWERFHLRYDSGRRSGSRRIRYDYLPSGADDFRSVIHDYSDNLTYSIDRRTGSCAITRGVEYPEVSPLRNPIEFFIKHERRIIYDPPEKRWQFNGYRSCRGSSIKCVIATASIDGFPAIVDSDTGVPSGDTWLASNVEYSWSTRSPITQNPNAPRFDYPVSLFMKMYRYPDPLNPNPLTIQSQNVEYEFYELSQDRSPYDFDISTCYRANGYEYKHSYFSIKIAQDNVIDGDKISIASLEYHVIRTIMEKSKVMKFTRIADVEIEHETTGNTLNVFFTMLGQTRVPETQSFDNTEPDANQALTDLKTAIDNGQFTFSMNLTDLTKVDFTAEKDSLKSASQYMSTHARGTVVTVEEYSSSAQAVAITVGLLIGLLVGILLVFIVRVIFKKPVPFVGTSVTNPVPRVNYSAKRDNTSTSA